MINVSVALIAVAMTTTFTMVTMKADRAEANANPVAVIRRKSTPMPPFSDDRSRDEDYQPGRSCPASRLIADSLLCPASVLRLFRRAPERSELRVNIRE
jgi:hypothetical protein